MSPADLPSSLRANRAIGAMFLSAFGTAWLAWGDLVVRGGPDWTLAPIVALGVLFFAVAWRTFRTHRTARDAIRATPRARRIARVFHAVNAGQWILILVLGNVLQHLGLGAWVVPMVIAVVGLHFLPLAAVMAYRPHYVTGAALLVLAATYPALAAAGPLSAAGQLGAGLILWASALRALARPQAGGANPTDRHPSVG